tara:strand:+ start:1841 stop:2806 length:966 start_codon:yes stop_codon:yes gene_type:complete
MKILVTGCAGFIGYHLCSKLLENQKVKLYGIDNLNNYYDVSLKKSRLKILKKNKNFIFNKLNILNKEKLIQSYKNTKIDFIVHLAAQAGVRHSISNPSEYMDINVYGFFNILEFSKTKNIAHLIFASTSSVYGFSDKFPLKENARTDSPESFYAATKKCNEVMAYSYSAIYKVPTTALRFFTVYGDYGRPDMALFKFVKNIMTNKSIEVYNHGKHLRDFTHVDEITDTISKILKIKPKGRVPFEIYNIGGSKPKKLMDFIKIIETKLGKKANIKFLPFQTGDVEKTHASSKKLNKKIKTMNPIKLEDGIDRFITWFKNFYN